MLRKINKSASDSAFKGGLDKKIDSPVKDKKPPQAPRSSEQLEKSILSCRTCQMISISDANRIMCQYCGSFYDPNFLKNRSDVKNPKKSSSSRNDSRHRRYSTSSRSNETNSGNEESGSDSNNNDSDSDTDSSTGRTSEKVKNFFKNLFAKRDVTKGSKKEEHIQMEDKKDKTSLHETIRNNMKSSAAIGTKKPIAPNISMHPFLALEAKDPIEVEEHRKKFLKGPEEFR